MALALRALSDEKSAAEWSAEAKVLLARLDESQRRWVVGLFSRAVGHGGDALMSRMTGLDPQTVQSGRREVAARLEGCPEGRVRRPGAGRPALEKKIRH
jgi:hypothetical protein